MGRPRRVLVSEGSSLSARQAITALGMAGHIVEVCDPDPLCMGRFSRFVRRHHRCPAAGRDPWAYLEFVLELLGRGGYDVLFPAHEQAFLFARERARIPAGVGLALADFGSFLRVQGKAALVHTLAGLGIPQPPAHVVRTRAELAGELGFPFYLKADHGTASNAVWRIEGPADLERTMADLEARGGLDGRQDLVVQQAAQGLLERVQAVFDRGHLAGIHGYRQVAHGIGGGDIVKLSVARAVVRRHVEHLGGDLRWHGALSLDYIFQEAAGTPLFIDANPRLVEPMNGVFSGINLADLLVRVSCGDPAAPAGPASQPVRSHMLLMGLLAAGARSRSRAAVLGELFRAAGNSGIYAGSREELLPLCLDYRCAFPLAYVLARLLIDPASAEALASRSVAAYSLGPGAARSIAGGTS